MALGLDTLRTIMPQFSGYNSSFRINRAVRVKITPQFSEYISSFRIGGERDRADGISDESYISSRFWR